MSKQGKPSGEAHSAADLAREQASTTRSERPRQTAALEPCESCDALPVSLERQLRYTLSSFTPRRQDVFYALAQAVKEQLLDTWRTTRAKDEGSDKRQVAYLSLEFLMGRTLGNALLNLELTAEARSALVPYALALEEVAQQEHDAGLGNGGLGRLAACFIDSCASMDIAVTGYGIRYEYGMFAQKLVEGFQIERPDRWLKEGNPWEVRLYAQSVLVPFFGHTESYVDRAGRRHIQWLGTHDVRAVPHDMPVPGYRNGRINTLRLWKAEATDDFDLDEFNQGDYAEAVARKNLAEQITMVLYPNDASENGKELRLRQQYFLCSASLQDLLRRHRARYGDDFSTFASHNVVQLNDTHPAIAVPELMRLLVDVHCLEWDAAWRITTATMAYTNHTLLPEALECWSVRMLGHMLPRILDIIYEINARYLDLVAHQWPGDGEMLARMSIIDTSHEPRVRMAYLAIVGSFSVNGVAALHTELLKKGLFKDFYALWSNKFNNKTNGVTPRRWLMACNPGLASLIDQRLGSDWREDLTRLSSLGAFTSDAGFIKAWQAVKRANKAALAALVERECNVSFDTRMLFDVQVKRIHEYKRQLLNVLHVIHLYQRVLRGDTWGMAPRCVLIGGKAAPGYAMAKLIIKFACNVAHMVNSDPRVSPWLRFAFLPNYNVSAMEVIAPGAELSEQISTAGKEASGTGNMKFMMNGALTMGTLDGANIEMLQAVGEDNFFLFGLNAEEVARLKQDYRPNEIIAASPALSDVLELIRSGHFSLQEPGMFEPILSAIESPADEWLTAADFDAFVRAQVRAAALYANPEEWTVRSIRNTAASGRFSSDATIARYRADIWRGA